ncbi:MAG TPA: helix-turn-helix domain-containing protein [Candidatus Dormibacteraeota bacterium]|jgi:AcrR family transcriptional regulator
MQTAQGLRQRKKERVRAQIFEAAQSLFARHGFDSVSVAAVAREAEVSEPTVFSYFPTKEDLFFDGLDSFESRLVEAVEQRPAGEPASSAFMAKLLASSRNLEETQRVRGIAAASKLIAGSAALQVREREIVARHTRELAAKLARETRSGADDIEAFAVANALMGLHRGLVEHVRSEVRAGSGGRELAAEFRRLARRAFGRLEKGLATYAVKGK